MKEKGSVSPKLLTYIKNLVCIVIIAVILAMSFGTIFTMKAPTEGKAVYCSECFAAKRAEQA